MTAIALSAKTRRIFERSQAARRILDAEFGADARLMVRGRMSASQTSKVAAMPSTERLTFGDVVQRIRAARLEKGWTQQRLANQSGIARANIARLEAGKHVPRVDTLEMLAHALSLPLAKLFETSASASKLRNLNEARLRAGASRVQETLKALREKRIVDEKGKRVSKELPAEMHDGTSDAV